MHVSVWSARIRKEGSIVRSVFRWEKMNVRSVCCVCCVGVCAWYGCVCRSAALVRTPEDRECLYGLDYEYNG